MNNANGGDRIPVEIFQILKDDAVKVLHTICQQIWKTQHGMKTDLPVATAESSKFAGILSATLSQHHLSGFGIAQIITGKKQNWASLSIKNENKSNKLFFSPIFSLCSLQFSSVQFSHSVVSNSL